MELDEKSGKTVVLIAFWYVRCFTLLFVGSNIYMEFH